MNLVEDQGQEEHKEGMQQFTSHNPSNSNLFEMSQMILEKSNAQFDSENPLFQPSQPALVDTYKGTRRSARRKAMKAKDKPTKGGGKKS
jgi:hypothetical protein